MHSNINIKLEDTGLNVYNSFTFVERFIDLRNAHFAEPYSLELTVDRKIIVKDNNG